MESEHSLSLSHVVLPGEWTLSRPKKLSLECFAVHEIALMAKQSYFRPENSGGENHHKNGKGSM